MGFLIEILGSSKNKRDLISEEELLKTHAKEMYSYLKSTLRYEIKVPVKKSDMMSPEFDDYLEKINRGQHSQPAVSDPMIASSPIIKLENNVPKSNAKKAAAK
jgi:hypothetical protein